MKLFGSPLLVQLLTAIALVFAQFLGSSAFPFFFHADLAHHARAIPRALDELLVAELRNNCAGLLNESMPVYQGRCSARGLNCTQYPNELCLEGPLNSSEPTNVFCGILTQKCVNSTIAQHMKKYQILITGTRPDGTSVLEDEQIGTEKEQGQCSRTLAPLSDAQPAGDGGNVGEQLFCGRMFDPLPIEEKTDRLPWEVEIVKYYNGVEVVHVCRGALIAANVVLSTADCVIDYDADGNHVSSSWFVRVGPNCTDIEVDEVVVHPKSEEEYGYESWNLVLLFLKNGTNDARIAKGAVSPICLPEKDDPISTDKCVISSDSWDDGVRGVYPARPLPKPAKSYHTNVTEAAEDQCDYKEFAFGHFKNTHCLEVLSAKPKRYDFDAGEYDKNDEPSCVFAHGATYQCQSNNEGKWTVYGLHGFSMAEDVFFLCLDGEKYYPFIGVSRAVPWIKRELDARGIMVPFHPADDKLRKKTIEA